MAAWLETATAPAPRIRPAPKRQAPARRRAVARPRILGGVVWIGVLAALLAGVVALNVAVLQLNLRYDELGRERANLRAANANLSSQLSSAASAPQIEALARKRLGLVPFDPEQTIYFELETPPR